MTIMLDCLNALDGFLFLNQSIELTSLLLRRSWGECGRNHMLGVFAFFLYSAAHAKRKLSYLPRVTEELARDIRIVFFFFFLLLVFTHRCNTVPTNARNHGLSGSLLIYSSRVDHLSSIIYAHAARLFIFAITFPCLLLTHSPPLIIHSSP